MNIDAEKNMEQEEQKPGPGMRTKQPELPKRLPEELSLEFERLKAARTCENLAGTASYLFSANRMQELEALFAHTSGDRITLPYGVYTGADAAKRCWVDDFVDADDPSPARHEELKGRMMIFDACSPIIEVAGDGKTARGLWISPGLEAHRTDEGSKGWWNWGKVAIDFLLIDGQWKLWHLARYPYFVTEYLKSWVKSPSFTFKPKRISADQPAPACYHYSPDAIYPDQEPALPLPYETWSDVVPGY